MVDELFVATKAFVVHTGKVLLLKESEEYNDGSNAGRWDVPGGRIEPGQAYDESLRREIIEETGLTVELGKPFAVSEWRPEVRGEKWQIVGIYFECQADSDNVVMSEDHEEYAWIQPESYEGYELIPGLEEIFEEYLAR